MCSSKGVSHSPALVTPLKIPRFPFVNKRNNIISFGGRLKFRKIPMAALAGGQNTRVQSEQGSAGRLCIHPGAHTEHIPSILYFSSYSCCRAPLRTLGREKEGAVKGVSQSALGKSSFPKETTLRNAGKITQKSISPCFSWCSWRAVLIPPLTQPLVTALSKLQLFAIYFLLFALDKL